MKLLILVPLLPSLVAADLFNNFFGHQMRQQPQAFDYQAQQLGSDCGKYLCPESFACVNEPAQCPCPFPDSQQKCVLPDGKNYVCISKTNKGELKDFKGEVRGCDWVFKAWKGQV